MDKLIKQMIKIEPELVLGLEDYPKVYILPAIITKENCTDVGEEYIGQIEYQVSDGGVGERSTSYDVYKWADVRKEVEKMSKEIENKT